MTDLRIYFHPRSPYSRLGLHIVRQERLAERADLSVHVFEGPPEGTAFLNPTDSKPKLRYILQDAPRMTLRAGLAIAPPLRPEPDYAAGIAAFYQAREQGKGLDFAIALSDARWGRSADIADESVLQECAEEAGVELGGGTDTEAHRAEDRAWISKDQVFGVPFAVIDRSGKTEPFWGQERFALIAESLIEG
ncbi:hypothetical protein HK107_05425 [Parvularcula sp. ZS-1/3]|uniref:DSBA-like thioredoxin domain-containing protein n=1 Tax=Parvularcula mediterranea TaxID=2732508 RepID=A0A7Y3W4P7_9PROT|nr:DsbA family protein [Parvularcula mediterranea]NNU15759.1 hypothetical protein [Parvularcula mediterranea]